MISIGNPYNFNTLLNKNQYIKNYESKNNEKLRRCNWSKKDMIHFIKNFDKHYNEALFDECLYNIEDYGLHYEEISDIISSQDPQEFHKKGIQNFFGGKIQNEPQTFDQLIESLKVNNNGRKNNAISDNTLEELKEAYISIIKKKQELEKIISEKINEEQQIEYIKKWAEDAKKNKSININEIISYINQIFKIIFNFYLKPAQIISILLLSKKNKNLGRIAQILTGEGKTAIILALAAINAILGHKVDIVTSSAILAKRDAESEKNKKFYDSLGLTVDHCIKNEKQKVEHGPKKCYEADIVYGDTHNFQADILSDIYMLENTRNGRIFDVLIADETDSMFVDDYGKSTLLSGEKPYMKRLNYILISIWTLLIVSVKGETKEIIQSNIEEIKKNYLKMEEKF